MLAAGGIALAWLSVHEDEARVVREVTRAQRRACCLDSAFLLQMTLVSARRPEGYSHSMPVTDDGTSRVAQAEYYFISDYRLRDDRSGWYLSLAQLISLLPC